MIEKLLENWLDNASERSYQAVFVQILSARGFQVIHSTRHTALEFGKDILAIDPEGTVCAYQLKGTPGGKLGLGAFRAEIQPQLVQLMTQCPVFPGIPEGVHSSFLVNNGYFQEEVTHAIDTLNRNPAFPSKVTLIDRGHLLGWCKELGTSLWPSELQNTRDLLELFLCDPKDLLPTKKLASLLEALFELHQAEPIVLKLSELERRAASAALLTGIATAPFAESSNHLAVAFAWTLFSTTLISAVEKHGQRLSGSLEQTLRLAELTIGDSLAELWEEVRTNPNLVEGNPLAEPEVRGWRHVTLTGALACLAFFDDAFGSLSEESRDGLTSWLKSPSLQFQVWGEGAIPPLVVRAVWCLVHAEGTTARGELAALAALLMQQNQPKGQNALGNLYCSWADVLSVAAGIPLEDGRSSIGEGAFQGSAYTAEALMHLLVRTGQKAVCQKLWPTFTRIAHHVCLHDEAWQYPLIHTPTGVNQTRIYPSTFAWQTLCDEAIGPPAAPLPDMLKARPWLLALYWQLAPWRFTVDANRVFFNSVCRVEDA